MENSSGAAPSLIVIIIYFAVIILVLAGVWKMFKKAGRPGWGALIPIYNTILMLEIAKRPIWWIILFFIPIANFIVAILVCIDLAKNFGKSTGFGLGIAFLPFIFIPILGFGDAKYQG